LATAVEDVLHVHGSHDVATVAAKALTSSTHFVCLEWSKNPGALTEVPWSENLGALMEVLAGAEL
jgi:hypothetical protein